MQKKHIVVVGSGFAGTYVARHLESLVKKGFIDVTIINRTNYFLFTPLLHEVATGGLTTVSIAEPIREIFRKSAVRFVQTNAKTIDTNKKIIVTDAGEIPYDYVVVSTGAETNFYNVPGAAEHTHTLKDLADAREIRNQIIDLCEHAALTTDEQKRRDLLSFVVVGGGPTGVESVAEIIEFVSETLSAYYKDEGLAQYASVTLICTSPKLLPQFDGKMHEIAHEVLVHKGVVVKTGVAVTKVTPNSVELSDTSTIQTSFVLWVAGVKAHAMSVPTLTYHPSGRIETDEYLRAVGHDDIFVLGDVSGEAPMLAQVAEQQAKVVAHNIVVAIKGAGTQTAFEFKSQGILVSLGQWNAVGKIYGVTLNGPLVWFLWRMVYLFKFLSWRKRVRIMIEWATNFFYPRDITKLK